MNLTETRVKAEGPTDSARHSKKARLAFGNAAEEYERGRARWPNAVARVGNVPTSAHVLDLGAGT
jgi:hypothetical protein